MPAERDDVEADVADEAVVDDDDLEVDDDDDNEDDKSRDPLDIPRFLNRQNNQ